MQKTSLKIGVIGAGFAGVSLVAALYRLKHPIEIILFDKTGEFGVGDAYRTPFSYHLLNVRAKDMSAYEDQPKDFANWLRANHNEKMFLDKHISIEEQFAPRYLFREYLSSLLHEIQADPARKITLKCQRGEVVDAQPLQDGVDLVLDSQEKVKVDKVVLALGNQPPSAFPFSITDTATIPNSWQYQRIADIPKKDPVLIIGTGLSMIDAVLTLHHQAHQGKIYALSRHGLLPLPHSNRALSYLLNKTHLPEKLMPLAKYVRQESETLITRGEDWRSFVHALRVFIPTIWSRASVKDKKQFIRHLLPYWNIHRHRVHHKIADLLQDLTKAHQLSILGGRVLKVEKGIASIRLRHSKRLVEFETKHVINCMGPPLTLGRETLLIKSLLQRQLAMLDPLGIGFEVDLLGALKQPLGDSSDLFYTVGSLRRGAVWECSAVPEIRQQSFYLAKHLVEQL